MSIASDIKIAVILAGGFGTRLTSVVSAKPKVMADVCGKPFLTYILKQVESFGIEEIVLCTGHLHKQILEYFGDRFNSIPITYCNESQPLGTGGALHSVLPWLSSSPVLVMNGDSFCKFDLNEFEVFHAVTESEVSMLLVEENGNSRSGLVSIALDDKITSFDEKKHCDTTSLVNAGVYIMNVDAIYDMPDKIPYSLETDFFPSIVNKGLYGMETDGPLIDIGTPESYRHAQFFFKISDKYDTVK